MIKEVMKKHPDARKQAGKEVYVGGDLYEYASATVAHGSCQPKARGGEIPNKPNG